MTKKDILHQPWSLIKSFLERSAGAVAIACTEKYGRLIYGN